MIGYTSSKLFNVTSVGQMIPKQPILMGWFLLEQNTYSENNMV